MEMPELKYETETCSRCGGSGHYSYNQISGTRCFKCHGEKRSFTKRGAAAKAFGDDLRATAIEDVKVGDRIYWGTGGRCTITQIDQPEESGVSVKRGEDWIPIMRIKVHGRKGFSTSFQVGEKVRKGWTADMINEVMNYQANLTKAGKPRKRPLVK